MNDIEKLANVVNLLVRNCTQTMDLAVLAEGRSNDYSDEFMEANNQLAVIEPIADLVNAMATNGDVVAAATRALEFVEHQTKRLDIMRREIL